MNSITEDLLGDALDWDLPIYPAPLDWGDRSRSEHRIPGSFGLRSDSERVGALRLHPDRRQLRSNRPDWILSRLLCAPRRIHTITVGVYGDQYFSYRCDGVTTHAAVCTYA